MMYPHQVAVDDLRRKAYELINLVFDGNIKRPDDTSIVSFVEDQIKVCDDMSQQVSNYKTMCDNRDETIVSIEDELGKVTRQKDQRNEIIFNLQTSIKKLEAEISEYEDIVEDSNRAAKYFIVLSVIGGFVAGFMSFPILM